MRLSDLKNKYEEPITITFKDKQITINRYVSEEIKLYIANKVKEIYFGEDIFISQEGSELNASDLSNKYLKFSLITFYLISFYTDIEIDETNYLEITNLAVQSGLYDKIIACIPLSERMHLFNLVDEAIEIEYRRIQEENSIENQIRKLISSIPNEDKIKELIQTVKKEFKEFDPNKLQFLNQMSKEYAGKEIPTVEDLEKLNDNVLQLVSKK